jgi:1,4-alpha-glucan branching enzyme
MTPSEYVFKQPSASFQIVSPKFSSAGFNGYAESWLDASNGKYYRHLIRAVCRMTELAEHLKNESGIKERALNQAARELLLALSSEWPRLISEFNNKPQSEWGIFAKNQIKTHLRNFTTIYEALGSTYISTRFLTELENSNNVFPKIDYRVFRRKKK